VQDKVKNQFIWAEFKKGNKKALEIIYKDYYSPLYNYGMKFHRDHNLVKDLIHELFVELIESGTKLSDTDNISFYLLRALRNKMIKQQLLNVKFTNTLNDNNDFDLVESIENQLIKTETEELLKKRIICAVKKLSDRQQEIIYLRFYCNLSYTEIAKLFNTNIQSCRNLLNRAISSLKDELNNKLSESVILFLIKLTYHTF